MIVPDKLKSADTAFLRRVQEGMCQLEQESRGCVGIECNLCLLDTGNMKVFGEWLHKQTKESLK